MKSLGANHGTTSHIRDLVTLCKMAIAGGDWEKLGRFMDAIERSNYAMGTKAKARLDVKKYLGEHAHEMPV